MTWVAPGEFTRSLWIFGVTEGLCRWRFWYVIFDTLKGKTNSSPPFASKSSPHVVLPHQSHLRLSTSCLLHQLDVTDKPRVECSCLEDERIVTPPKRPLRRRRSWSFCYFDSSSRGATRDALRARALRGQGIVVHHKDVLIRGSGQEGKWTVIGVVILKDGMVKNWSRRTRGRRRLSLR